LRGVAVFGRRRLLVDDLGSWRVGKLLEVIEDMIGRSRWR
jgi:hypothetical protein